MSREVRPEFAAEGWMPLNDPMSAKPGQVVRWFDECPDGAADKWQASGGTVYMLDPRDGPVSFGYINFGSLQGGQWEVYAPSDPAANEAGSPPRAEFDSDGWEPLGDIMQARLGDAVRGFYYDPVRDIWDAEGGIVTAVDPSAGLFAGGDYLIAPLDSCDDWEIRRTV